MSYILDALRKSDQQRQRGAAPTLQSAPSFAETREPRGHSTYAVVALVLAVGAFSIGWLRPWETAAPPARAVSMTPQAMDSKPGEMIPARSVIAPRPDEISPQPVAAASPAEAGKESSATPAADAPAPQRAESPIRASSADAPAAAAMKAESARKHAAHAARETVASSKAPKGAEREGGAGAKEEKPKDEKVVTLAELPASVRQELPQMTITVHSYSRTPKDRLLGVNDKLLHEGESLTPDRVLERITPDGMIFNYRGTRFQRGIQ